MILEELDDIEEINDMARIKKDTNELLKKLVNTWKELGLVDIEQS